MVRVEITINPKDGLLDPESAALLKTIHGLNYPEIKSIRIGKKISIEIDENERRKIEQKIGKLCEGLLVQPILEDYQFEIKEDES